MFDLYLDTESWVVGEHWIGEVKVQYSKKTLEDFSSVRKKITMLLKVKKGKQKIVMERKGKK